MVAFRMNQTTKLATNTKTPMATTPSNCTPMLPLPKIPTANVPPDASHEVSGEGADDVIDLHLVEHRNGEDNQRATDAADNDGLPVGIDIRPGRDGDQSADRTVQRHRQIDLAVADLCQRHRDDDTGGGRDVGIGIDDGDFRRLGRAAQGQGGAAVEAEPAEPQDECAQRGERQVGAGHRLNRAGAAVLASTRAEQASAGKRRPSTGRMHQRGAGIVAEAHPVQPAAAPNPGRLDRIDQRGKHGPRRSGRATP